MKDFVLNEGSLPFNSIEDACANMERFVSTCIACKKVLCFTTLRTPQMVSNLILHDYYNIGAWLKDASVDKELRQLFRSIISKSPIITVEDTQSELYDRSVFYHKKQVYGLGVAYLLNTLAVSFASHTDWDSTEVLITHNYIDIETFEWLSKTREVKHAISKTNVSLHEATFRHDYNILWQKRDDFFLNLSFQRQVERKLKMWSGTNREIMLDTFILLNKYASQWEKPTDIGKYFSEVSNVGNDRYVFDIKGNHLRLIVATTFHGTIDIRFIGTHKEYDRINASEI